MDVEEGRFCFMQLARMLCVSDVNWILKHQSGLLGVQLPDFSPSEPTQSGVPEEDVITTASESNNSQFIRLFRDSKISLSADRGSPLIQRLKDLRKHASKPTKLVSREQWLRTVVTDLKSRGVDALRFSGRDYAIQIKVVPRDHPYGKQLERARSSEDNEVGDMERCTRRDWIERCKKEMIDMNKEPLILRRKIKPSVEDRALEALFSEEHDSEKKDPAQETRTTFPVLIPGNRFRKGFWNGGRFGVKVFPEAEKQTFFDEVKVLQRIGTHPHIVHSFGVSEPEGGVSKPEGDDEYKYWMELLDGDLDDVISEWRRLGKDGKVPSGVPFQTVPNSMCVLLQIAKAMKRLHEVNVIHGDLRPANIGMSHYELSGSKRGYIVKVIDFDRATIIKSDDEKKVPISWLDEYMAPEACKYKTEGKKLSGSSAKKCEVYSFGIVAVEVLAGVLLGQNSDVKQADSCQDRHDHIMKLVDLGIYNSGLIDLVESCLKHKASLRPESFKEVTEKLTKLLIDAEDPRRAV